MDFVCGMLWIKFLKFTQANVRTALAKAKEQFLSVDRVNLRDPVHEVTFAGSYTLAGGTIWTS